MSKIALKISNISKSYAVHTRKPTLIEKLIYSNPCDTYWALKNIKLNIKKGEFVGIIGLNGAGKTTLLKVISKIIKPTKGSVTVNGKIVSLIDLTAGFHPDLTGIENIYINGMLFGMSKKEISLHMEDIIDFADIRDFIYQPTHTYSNGMLLRLGFAIITFTDPDVLVFDENLFVGDRDFYVKIHNTLVKWKTESKTLILSSHNLHFITKYCERGVLLKNGVVEKQGDINNVVHHFTKDLPKQFVTVLFNRHYDE